MARILYFSRNAQGNVGDQYLYGKKFVLSLHEKHEVLVRHFVVQDKIADLDKFPKGYNFYEDLTDYAEIESFNPDLIFFEGPIIRHSTWAISPLWLEEFLQLGGCVITEGVNLLSLQGFDGLKDADLLEDFFHFVDVYPENWLEYRYESDLWPSVFSRVKGQVTPDRDDFPSLDYYHSASIAADVYRTKWTEIWDDVNFVVGRDSMPFDFLNPHAGTSPAYIAYTGFAVIEKGGTSRSNEFESRNPKPIAAVSLKGCGYLVIIGSDFVADRVCAIGVNNHKFLNNLVSKIISDANENKKIRNLSFVSFRNDEEVKVPNLVDEKAEAEMTRKLIAAGEGFLVEFKRSFLKSSETQDEVMNQISGFANSEGGHLLVGVEDDGSICGVDSEIKQAGSLDNYLKRMTNIAREALDTYFATLFVASFVLIDGKSVLKIEIRESKSKIIFRNQKGSQKICYARTNSGIQKLDSKEVAALQLRMNS